MQTKPEWSAHPATPDVPLVTTRSVPAPDTSTIDLTTILTADDLPVWLQDVALRPASPGSERDSPSNSGDVTVETVRSHADSVSHMDANPVTQPWWTSDRIMAGLLIAVVLTILFVLITTIRLR
jgi:hypothetical protein